MVGEVARGDTSVEHLVELTLGQKAEAAFHREWRARRPTASRCSTLRDLHVGARVRGVDLTSSARRDRQRLRPARLGSGTSSRARSPATCPTSRGTFVVDGRERRRRARRARRSGSGIALITENRQEEGLFPDMSVRSNISISSLARVVFAPLLRVIDRRKERRLTAAVAESTGIAPALARAVASESSPAGTSRSRCSRAG